MALRARIEALLARHWWQPQPTLLTQALRPLAAVYGIAQRRAAARAAPPAPLPVPVVVVGNVVAGGAGKTPTVIALVDALVAVGRRPGVVSRGWGRLDDAVRDVDVADDADAVGDEPLVIRRRCGVPVWVGRDRAAAVRALCARHPGVDVVVADDGLQHAALARAVDVAVFDERGVGNGRLLPAGPLRQPLPANVPATMRVLYTAGRPSTSLPGAVAQRRVEHAWPLAAWRAGDAGQRVPLAALQGRDLVAVAGIASPEKFYASLRSAGLTLSSTLALPDHHRYATLPWPAATADVVTTEKDAVKLDPSRIGGTRVWVVPLDLDLPRGWVRDLLALLALPE